MDQELFKARWDGPFDTQLGPGHTISRGEEHEVTAEDLRSSHWVGVGAKAKKVEAAQQKAGEEQAEAVSADSEPSPDTSTDEENAS